MPKIELEIEDPSFCVEFNDPQNPSITHVETLLPFYEIKKLKRGNANVRPPESGKRPFKAMIETIENSPKEFHIKNRGITYICNKVVYDKDREKLIIHIPEYDETKMEKEDSALRYGIADGGHTFEAIIRTVNEENDYAPIEGWKMPYGRVHFIATQDLRNIEPIVEALNTSTQVQQVTLDEFQNKFASLKVALRNDKFDLDLVAFKENEDRPWNVVEVIQRLACFIPERWESHHPMNMQKSKNKALSLFTNEETREEFKDLYPVIKDIITFPEYIQSGFSEKIGIKGKIPNGVKILKKEFIRPGTDYHTLHKFNISITLPIAAAFRKLLKRKKDEFSWAVEPHKVFDECSDRLYEHLIKKSAKYDHISQISTDIDYWSGAVRIVQETKEDLLENKTIVRKKASSEDDNQDKDERQDELNSLNPE